jgi:hypothetical protein
MLPQSRIRLKFAEEMATMLPNDVSGGRTMNTRQMSVILIIPITIPTRRDLPEMARPGIS